MINNVLILIAIVFFLSIGTLFSMENDSISEPKEEVIKIDSSVANEFYVKIEEQLKKFIPEIKNVLKDSFKKVSKSALSNEKVMETTFRKSYQFLPLPIRLMVDQDVFVKFCMRNRNLLLEIK